MKKKKTIAILSILSLCTLASCEQTASSSSSSWTSSSSSSSSMSSTTESTSSPSSTTVEDTSDTEPEPEPVTYTNYRRTGDVQATFSLFGPLNVFQFDAPVDYSFVGGSDGTIGPDHSLTIHPNEGTAEDGTENWAENYKFLNFLYGFGSSMGPMLQMFIPSFSVDFPADFIPASEYYGQYEDLTSEELADEALTIDVTDGSMLTYTDTADTNNLRVFEESALPSISVDTGDLEGLLGSVTAEELDLTQLLTMVDMLFPDDSTLRPIASILGNVFYILGDGLDVDVDPDMQTGSVDVSLSLNNTGLARLGSYLTDLSGMTLSFDALDFGFGLFGDESYLNQIGNVHLDLSLTLSIEMAPGFAMSIPVSFGLNLDLGQERTALEADYFDKRAQALEPLRATDAAFEDFFAKTQPYMNGETAGIDIRSSGEALVEGYADTFAALGEDVKFMLGEAGKVDEQTMLDNYGKGRTALQGVLDGFDAETVQSFADVETLLKPIASYAYWKEALSESEQGKAVLSTLKAILDKDLDGFQSTALELLSAVGTVENDEARLAEVAKYDALVSEIGKEKAYMDETESATADAILLSLQGYLDLVFATPVATAVTAMAEETSYAELKAMFVESGSFRGALPETAVSSYDAALKKAVRQNKDALSHADDALEAEVQTLEKTLVQDVASNKEAVRQEVENVDTLTALFGIPTKTGLLKQILALA